MLALLALLKGKLIEPKQYRFNVYPKVLRMIFRVDSFGRVWGLI